MTDTNTDPHPALETVWDGDVYTHDVYTRTGYGIRVSTEPISQVKPSRLSQVEVMITYGGNGQSSLDQDDVFARFDLFLTDVDNFVNALTSVAASLTNEVDAQLD